MTVNQVHLLLTANFLRCDAGKLCLPLTPGPRSIPRAGATKYRKSRAASIPLIRDLLLKRSVHWASGQSETSANKSQEALSLITIGD